MAEQRRLAIAVLLKHLGYTFRRCCKVYAYMSRREFPEENSAQLEAVTCLDSLLMNRADMQPIET